MTESVWVTLIQFLLSPIILLVLGSILNRRIKETKQEITNSHPIHLRDDLDNKFKLVFARQDSMLDRLVDMDDKLSGHMESASDEHRLIHGILADHESRLTGQAKKIRTIAPRKHV